MLEVKVLKGDRVKMKLKSCLLARHLRIVCPTDSTNRHLLCFKLDWPVQRPLHRCLCENTNILDIEGIAYIRI